MVGEILSKGIQLYSIVNDRPYTGGESCGAGKVFSFHFSSAFPLLPRSSVSPSPLRIQIAFSSLALLCVHMFCQKTFCYDPSLFLTFLSINHSFRQKCCSFFVERLDILLRVENGTQWCGRDS